MFIYSLYFLYFPLFPIYNPVLFSLLIQQLISFFANLINLIILRFDHRRQFFRLVSHNFLIKEIRQDPSQKSGNRKNNTQKDFRRNCCHRKRRTCNKSSSDHSCCQRPYCRFRCLTVFQRLNFPDTGFKVSLQPCKLRFIYNFPITFQSQSHHLLRPRMTTLAALQSSHRRDAVFGAYRCG